jgi:hypothetical protein
MNKETIKENNIIDSGLIKITKDKEVISKDKEVISKDKEQKNITKRKVGRPPYLVTEDTKNKVYNLSIVGTRYEDIALVLGISDDTLTKYYKSELEKGRIEANAAVAGTLFEKAKQGDTSSMIFWLKTRAQWSEKNTTELTGEGGAPINIKVVTGIE